MLLKKGAMFGLDARIALAIFGALSVISGAALYSAIQDSKVTAIITQFNEVGKAWEAYYLDTGLNPDRMSTDNSTTNYFVIKTLPLMENPTVTGWSGPYYQTPTHTSANLLTNEGYDLWLMQLSKDVDWSSWTTGTCTTGRSCAIWIRYYDATEVFSDSIKAAIDEKIDNADGADKGSFRYSTDSINYLYAPIKNPIDN